jgi:hypothetical protein
VKTLTNQRNLRNNKPQKKEKDNMKRLTGILVVGLFVFALTGNIFAQTDNHNVNIIVQAISVMALNSSAQLDITITTAVPGSEPTPVTNTTRTLSWTTNEATKKVTVEANAAYATYELKALATSITGGGSAAAEKTFDDAVPADFVTGVDTEIGGCTIQYTATATAAAGSGSEMNNITFTLVNE